jgi:hypothetical protein
MILMVSGSHFRVGWQIFNANYKLDTAVIRRTAESPALRHLALRQSAYSGGLTLAHNAIIAGHLWGCCFAIISNH